MAVAPAPAWPPEGPTSVRLTIPAYPYVQYQNDDRVTAFFEAYNLLAQTYVDWFNSVNLPIYTQIPVQGPLLDWVAQGLYGIQRPSLPTSIGTPPKGPVNSLAVNVLQVNGYAPGTPESYTSTNDDTFRRIITWAFFKGDGRVASPRWLKRRINRFLNGADGKNITNDTTFDVSIAPTGVRTWTITLADTLVSRIFKTAVQTGAIDLPFQVTWTITLV